MDPLKDILRNNYYIIPENQRGYSWRKPHAEALINDLNLMGGSSHYMGTIIVTWAGESKDFQDDESRDHTKGFILDDGQQRLTTFLLLIHCFVNRFKQIGEDTNTHSKDLKSYLTYSKDGKHLRIQNHQTELDQFLRHLLLGDSRPSSRTAPMMALVEVFDYFSDFFKDLELNELIDWKLKVSAQAKFILVDLQNGNIDRYLAFDAINSRGLPLTEFDKVKNFCALLTKRRPGLSTNNPEGSWYKALEALEKFSVTTRQGESTFIAEAHSVFVNERVGNDKIHEHFVDQYNKLLSEDDTSLEGSLKDYVKKWETYAAAFGFVISQKRQSIAPGTATARANANLTNIDHMKLPGITRPLLCAGLQKYTKQEFEKLTGWCEIYTFRVHALAQRRTDKNSQGIIWLANMILFGGKSIDDVGKQLCKWLDGFAPLRGAFDFLSNGGVRYHYDTKMKGWSHCYYFLHQYELSTIHGGASPPTWQDAAERQKSSIEHILPQTHRDGSWWESHWKDPDLAEKYKHRLGNLVLTNNNSSLGQKAFPQKLEDPPAPYYYKHNDATNTEKLIRDYTDGSNWHKNEILKREAALIIFALDRWSMGCCSDNDRYVFPDEFSSALADKKFTVNKQPCVVSSGIDERDPEEPKDDDSMTDDTTTPSTSSTAESSTDQNIDNSVQI